MHLWNREALRWRGAHLVSVVLVSMVAHLVSIALVVGVLIREALSCRGAHLVGKAHIVSSLALVSA